MKTLQTANGHDVLIHNMHGPGTFPIKGTILKKPPKQNLPLRYEIWKADGRVGLFGISGWDLILEEENKNASTDDS